MSSEERQTVAVTIESSTTVVGGEVKAVVTITGDSDRKVRGATAQLMRNAIHRISQTEVVWGRGQKVSLLHEDVVVTEVPIFASGATVAPGQYVVSLQVPEDGLPSATDQVIWSVRVVIERHLGADVTAESVVQVLAGPERFAGEGTTEARYQDEQCIDLELSTRSLRPGETITGTVHLRPTRSMTVTEVLVLFVVTTPAKKGLKGTPLTPNSLLDEPLDLQAGDVRRLPFDLLLPADVAPTVRGSKTTPPCQSVVSWDVGAEAKCIVSADDETKTKGFVFLGINVYNAGSL